MPKSVSRLNLAEKYDKEALERIRKAIEFEEAAVNTESPADREKYGVKASEEREAAIEALRNADIASGPEITEAVQDSDPGV